MLAQSNKKINFAQLNALWHAVAGPIAREKCEGVIIVVTDLRFQNAYNEWVNNFINILLITIIRFVREIKQNN